MTRFVRPGCSVGIIFALETEADPFAREASDITILRGAGGEFRVATVADRRVAWGVSGAGVHAASRMATMLLEGHRPGLVVSAGFAGGLDPQIPRGALVIAARACRIGHPSHDLHPTPTGLFGSIGCERIVTVDAVVTTVEEKRRLRESSGAAIVDMETHGVAAVAAGHHAACLSLRVVSDGASDELPADIARLVAPQSPMRRAGAALAAIGRKPTSAATMWRLWENAVVDGRTLAAAIVQAVAAFPAETG